MDQVREIGGALNPVFQLEEVFGVNHPHDMVDVVATERIASVLGLSDRIQVLGKGSEEAQVNDVGTRYHDVLRGSPRVVEDVLQQSALGSRERPSAMGLRQQQAELFFRVREQPEVTFIGLSAGYCQ